MFESAMKMFQPRGTQQVPGTAQAKQPEKDGSGTQPPAANPQDNSQMQQVDKTKLENASPLDGYADLWNTASNNSGEQQQQNNNQDKTQNQQTQTPAKTEPRFTPEKLQAAAKKIDFARNLPPDLIGKAFPNGDATAISQIINHIGRTAFVLGGHTAGEISSDGLSGFKTSFEAELPNRIRSHAIHSSGYKNQAYKHPALKPFVDLTKQQMMQKYPEATPEDIDQHVETYMSGILEAVGKGNPEAQTQQAAAATNTQGRQLDGTYDWNKEFLGASN